MSDVQQYLFELADSGPASEPAPICSHGSPGVALPEKGPIVRGAFVTTEYARKLGAQLIRCADLVDAIEEAGRKRGGCDGNVI